MSYQRYKFTWQGIEIEARYAPLKWDVIAHLEIQSVRPERAPLPITQTGFLSHHHQPNSIEDANGGDVVAFIIAWLDEEAKSADWQCFLDKSRQGELF